MDSYEVIISPKALSQLNEYIDYIQYTLLNDQAARRVWQDAMETAEKLETAAGSLRLCAHPMLKSMGYHPFFFQHHSYVMLYRIQDRFVFIEAIYHTQQDYENTFSQEAEE